MFANKLKKKLANLCQVPEEIVLDIPKIDIVDDNQLLIENYKGVVEYEAYKVRIKVSKGIVTVEGNNLIIDEISADDVIIRGKIKCLSLNYGII